MKYILSLLTLSSLVILAGCASDPASVNVNTGITETQKQNENAEVVVANANDNVNAEENTNTANEPVNNNPSNTITSDVDMSNWNTFAIDQIGATVDLPFEPDEITFGEATCGLEEFCDYEGYWLHGEYTLPDEQALGFFGSVSERWSPPRERNLHEVYDLQKKGDSYTVYFSNDQKLNNGTVIEEFEIDGHQVVIFDVDNTNQKEENYIFNDYLGVVKINNSAKYRAFALSFSKDDMTEEEFKIIMSSISFL